MISQISFEISSASVVNHGSKCIEISHLFFFLGGGGGEDIIFKATRVWTSQ